MRSRSDGGAGVAIADHFDREDHGTQAGERGVARLHDVNKTPGTGVVPGALGYLTWTWVLAKMPASRAAGSLYAIPPLAYLFSWIFLGEKPGPLTIAGAGVVLAGVALVNIGGARRD